MEVITNNQIINHNDAIYSSDYLWTSLFTMEFVNLDPSIIKQILQNFYDWNIKNVDSDWKYYEKCNIVKFEHYSNKQQYKYMIRATYLKDVDFYLIGYLNKYVAYCNYNYKIQIVTHNTKIIEKYLLEINTTPKRDDFFKFEIEDRIIVEYHQKMKERVNNYEGAYFYIIQYKNKPFVEIYNGCHWIFKCKEKLELTYEFCKQLIKPNATSSIMSWFGHNDIITPMMADPNILVFNIGKLIFFASDHNIHIVNSYGIMVNYNYKNLFDNYKKIKQKTINILKDLGYDVTQFIVQNYDYIYMCDYVHNYPVITYKSYKDYPDYESTTECTVHKYEKYNFSIIYNKRKYSHNNTFDYTDYSITFYLTENNKYYRVIVKFNGKIFVCADMIWENIPNDSNIPYYVYDDEGEGDEEEEIDNLKSENYNLKFKIRYFNNKIYKKFSNNINNCVEKILITHIVSESCIRVDNGILYENILLGALEHTDETNISSLYLSYINSLFTKKNINPVEITYNKLYKQFNLHINPHLLGGGPSKPTPQQPKSEQVDTKEDFRIFSNKVSETNTILNLDERRIIMNDGNNNALVDIDMCTQETKSITIGYKYGIRAENEDSKSQNVVIVLELPEVCRIISCPDKHRTDQCRVLRIYDPITNTNYNEAYGKYMNNFKYMIGSNILINNFVMNNKVCYAGIHFCHSLMELTKWN
jgi:hypothetical protein